MKFNIRQPGRQIMSIAQFKKLALLCIMYCQVNIQNESLARSSMTYGYTNLAVLRAYGSYPRLHFYFDLVMRKNMCFEKTKLNSLKKIKYVYWKL